VNFLTIEKNSQLHNSLEATTTMIRLQRHTRRRTTPFASEKLNQNYFFFFAPAAAAAPPPFGRFAP
jgi:hypothetical protein